MPLTHSNRLADTKPTGSTARSRVSNGAVFVEGVDQRSTWVRRAKDVMALLLSDRGGADMTSEAERLIVRRASVIEVELERMERRFAQAGGAETNDLDAYQRAAGNQRRLLESVGLKRVPKDVTPTVREYLANKAATKVDARAMQVAD